MMKGASCAFFKEGKGREGKGKERKGKERKGKERKGKERKGKEIYKDEWVITRLDLD